MLLLIAGFATMALASGENSCGTPARKVKWKRGTITTFPDVDSSCDCSNLCTVVHNTRDHVAWWYKTKSKKCTCVDADLKHGTKAVKLQKYHGWRKFSKPSKSPPVYSSVDKAGWYRSKIHMTLDRIGEIASKYIAQWSIIVTRVDPEADTGYSRLYEYAHGTTTATANFVASQSKWVSAYAVLREMVAGGLELDDPVCPYVDKWDCEAERTSGDPDPELVNMRSLLAFQDGSFEDPATTSPCPANDPENPTMAGADYETCMESILQQKDYTKPVMNFYQYNHYHHAMAGNAITGLTGKTVEQFTLEAMRDIGMDSSQFLTVDSLYKAISGGLWGGPDIVDMGGSLLSSPDDLEKFHMAWLMRTLPGIPTELYEEWGKEYWHENLKHTTFATNKITTGNVAHNTGSYALGHWRDCPWTFANPWGSSRAWKWCEPRDHHSLGFFGTNAHVDEERKFMVQTMIHPGAIRGALAQPEDSETQERMGMPVGLMLSRTVKLLLNKLMADEPPARDVCFHLCLIKHGLSAKATYTAEPESEELLVTTFLDIHPKQLAGYSQLRDEIHEAVGCAACPGDFDPSEAWYMEG